MRSRQYNEPRHNTSDNEGRQSVVPELIETWLSYVESTGGNGSLVYYPSIIFLNDIKCR